MSDIQVLALTAEDEMKDKFLIFSVNAIAYALEISYVTDIIDLETITPVPQMPNYLSGIINLRGTIVPIMDMRVRFGVPPAEYTDRTCIIVLSFQDMGIGLIVDSVHEVASIPEEDLLPPPIDADQTGGSFVKGIGMLRGEVKQIVDLAELIIDA